MEKVKATVPSRDTHASKWQDQGPPVSENQFIFSALFENFQVGFKSLDLNFTMFYNHVIINKLKTYGRNALLKP